MIIQCRKCETKFRFDETVISGEGVWVRCSVCKDVFFQDNPVKERISSVPTAETGTPPGPVALEDEPVMVERRAMRVDQVFPPEPPESGKGDLLTLESAGERDEFDDDEEDDDETLTGAGRRRGGSLTKVLSYVLLILLIIGGAYLWFFPPLGGQAVWEMVSSLPLVDKITGGSQKQQDFGIGQVQIQALKQRVVKNMVLGDLRVVEGMAVNQSEFTISRLQVRGRAYDAAGGVLQERISFCGNILTDEELTALTEDSMQKVFSLDRGRDGANDRVEANGRIPFMIVFANLPAGPGKITVLPVGAEILLP